MDILGFIKNKNASRQQSVAQTSQSQQKPETAKEMYTRVAAEEQAAKKPITPAVEAKADRVRALETIYKATQHLDSASPLNRPLKMQGARQRNCRTRIIRTKRSRR